MKNYLLILFFVLEMIAGTTTAIASNKAPSRALWIWEASSYAMVEDSEIAEDAFSFMKKNGVNVIYLYADAYKNRNLLIESPYQYQIFIERAHMHGMRVYALLGSYYLHTENGAVA